MRSVLVLSVFSWKTVELWLNSEELNQRFSRVQWDERIMAILTSPWLFYSLWGGKHEENKSTRNKYVRRKWINRFLFCMLEVFFGQQTIHTKLLIISLFPDFCKSLASYEVNGDPTSVPWLTQKVSFPCATYVGCKTHQTQSLRRGWSSSLFCCPAELTLTL